MVETRSGDRAAATAEAALKRGIILLAGGPRLQIAPPLTITERQWTHCLDTLGQLLADDNSTPTI